MSLKNHFLTNNTENNMKKIKCEMCGGNNILKQDAFYVCQDCGVKYTPEEAKKLLVDVETNEEKDALIKTHSNDTNSPTYNEDITKDNDANDKIKINIDEETKVKIETLREKAYQEILQDKIYDNKTNELYNSILQLDPNDLEANFHKTYASSFIAYKTDEYFDYVSKVKSDMYTLTEKINKSDLSKEYKFAGKVQVIILICNIAFSLHLGFKSDFDKVEKKNKQEINIIKKKCLAVAFLQRDCADLFFDYDMKDLSDEQLKISGLALGCMENFVEQLAFLKPYLEPEDLDGEYVDEYLTYPISLLKTYKKDYKIPDNIDYL